MNNADDYVGNCTIVLERLMRNNVEVCLIYNYADIPFVFFECTYRKENELCRCSLIPAAESKFNFADIYYQNKEFEITVEYDPFGISLWLETIYGKELLAGENLIEIRDEKPIIGEKLRHQLRRLRKLGALNSFARAFRLTLTTSKEVIRAILDILNKPELREEIYTKIRQKDIEMYEENNPECFYKMDEFIRDIKLIGRAILDTNNLIRKILRIAEEYVQGKA
ncbi:MAG: hypothetical protein Q6363_005175 [Candidatus Njordarchaeota archaeon]